MKNSNCLTFVNLKRKPSPAKNICSLKSDLNKNIRRIVESKMNKADSNKDYWKLKQKESI